MLQRQHVREEGLKGLWKAQQILSRIMMDDEYLGSADIPSAKLSATLPKKRKPKPQKRKVEESDDDEPPKKKAAPKPGMTKAVEAALEKIAELSEELAGDLKKGDKKKANEITKLATTALDVL